MELIETSKEVAIVLEKGDLQKLLNRVEKGDIGEVSVKNNKGRWFTIRIYPEEVKA